MNSLPDARIAALLGNARVWRAKPGQLWPYASDAPLLHIDYDRALRDFSSQGGSYAIVSTGLLGLSPPEAWLLDALTALQHWAAACGQDDPTAFPIPRNIALRAMRKLGTAPPAPHTLSKSQHNTALLLLDVWQALQADHTPQGHLQQLHTRLLCALEPLLDAPQNITGTCERSYLLWLGACLMMRFPLDHKG